MAVPELKTVVPFFQPIILADDQSVFGYEVLARESRGGTVRSLGSFFEDSCVSDQEKHQLDLHVQTLALKAYAASGSRAKIFLNIRPSWIYANKDEASALETLVLLERFGLDPRNIVIEVTEEDLLGDYAIFGSLLTQYRRAGCLLAIDDFGKGASSIQRIAWVTPDIIKMDRSIVQRMDSHRPFFEISQAMATFGDILGFDLLFEGVETAFQLERCIAANGRYFQGFLFAQGRPDFSEKYENRDLLCDLASMKKYRNIVMLDRHNKIASKMEEEVERLASAIPLEEEALAAPFSLRHLTENLPYYCVRCFVCDHNGRQLSPVCHLGAHASGVARNSKGSAWLFREFFLQGVGEIRSGRTGFLSGVYKNVATKENVATYMHSLQHNRPLCVDIMATVLA